MLKDEYKIEISFSASEVKELKPHYGCFNEYVKQIGVEPYSFECFIKMALTLGCKHTMLRNAERMVFDAQLAVEDRRDGNDEQKDQGLSKE